MTTPTPEPNPLSMSREEREKLACRVRREYQGINVPIVEVHLTDLRGLIHAVLDYEREMVEMENKMAGRDIMHHEVEADYRRERDAAREELALSEARSQSYQEDCQNYSREWKEHEAENKRLTEELAAANTYSKQQEDVAKRMTERASVAQKRVAELEVEQSGFISRARRAEEEAANAEARLAEAIGLLENFAPPSEGLVRAFLANAPAPIIQPLDNSVDNTPPPPAPQEASEDDATRLSTAEAEIIRLAALDEIKSKWLKEMEEKFDILRDSFQHNVDVWDSVEERVRRLEDWLRRTDGLFKECFDRLSAIEARMGEVSDT